MVINMQYPVVHSDHVRLRFMPRSEGHYPLQVLFWGFCEGWMDLNLSIFY